MSKDERSHKGSRNHGQFSDMPLFDTLPHREIRELLESVSASTGLRVALTDADGTCLGIDRPHQCSEICSPNTALWPSPRYDSGANTELRDCPIGGGPCARIPVLANGRCEGYLWVGPRESLQPHSSISENQIVSELPEPIAHSVAPPASERDMYNAVRIAEALSRLLPAILDRNAEGWQTSKDRKRAEAAVVLSATRLRCFLEDSPVGVFRASVENDAFLDANKALLGILGLRDTSELSALRISTEVFASAEEYRLFLNAVGGAVRFNGLEFQWKRKDRTLRNVRMSGRCIADGSRYGRILEGIVEDITEYRRLEQKARRAEKFQVIGRLAGGIAHDFNNVLMTISTYADLILECTAPSNNYQRYASKIHETAMNATAVTKRLLAFSRQQALKPESLDLSAVLQNITQILPSLLGDEVRIVAELEPVWPVWVDRIQLEQAIITLAESVQDTMGAGGRLTIGVHNTVVKDTLAVQHPPAVPGDYVRIAITTPGFCVTAVSPSLVLDPVSSIVEQSGGLLTYDSEPVRGSTFSVYLPRYAELVSGTSPQPQNINTAQNETILLVEDERSLREGLHDYLASSGYSVLSAASGTEALSACAGHTGSLSVLLTDLVMPGLSGIELANLLRQRYPQLAVLYMTGFNDREVQNLDKDAPVLRKPFTLDTLKAKLRELLDGSRSKE